MLSKISDERSLLDAIRDEAMANGNLSIRGVARLAEVQDTAIIRSADFRSTKLAEKLTALGFGSADLAKDGFPPQAVVLTLEYFAYESKVQSLAAKALFRTFGVIGLMRTLDELAKPSLKPQPMETPVPSVTPIPELLGLVKESLIRAGVSAPLAEGVYLNGIAHHYPAIAPQVQEAHQLLAGSTESTLLLTPGSIGKQLGISAIAVNKLLVKFGYQTANKEAKKGEPNYLPTELGKPYASNTIATGRVGDNSSYQHLKWKQNIVEILQQQLEGEK